MLYTHCYSDLIKKLQVAEAVSTTLENNLDTDLKNVGDRTTSISRIMMYEYVDLLFNLCNPLQT